MAQRRMFSKEITNSSDFQMMSPSAQALYFHIGMNSDDDGFCEAFTIVRMTESKPDDLSALHQRGFIFLVDSKVCIVKDWHTNNDIRVDRYSRSKYLDKPQYADVYGVIMEDKIKHLSRYKAMLPSGSTSGSTQVRLGKVSITSELEDEIRVVEVSSFEGEEKAVRKPAKYPHRVEVSHWFPDPQPSWLLNTTECKHMELLYLRGEAKVHSILKYLKAHEEDEYCPQVTKPSDLERKWADIVAYSKKN